MRSELDPNRYGKGKKISPQQMDELLLVRSQFHGEWNYLILPRTHPTDLSFPDGS
ncbi:MAG: hypothetical protein HY791_34070 [Deltaproteobacteria bacterium]|nr:hypothetical protein [Deltaproteobacteria bacterium]